MSIPIDSWAIFFIFAGLSVFFMILSKVGFGGGGGNLATPLLSLVVPAQTSLGILLPLLCISDLFMIYYYRTWNWSILKPLVAVSIVGVAVGSLILGRVPDTLLKQVIGVLSIIFVLVQLLRGRVTVSYSPYEPRVWHSYLAGLVGGITSTVAHQGGPMITIFLLPQKLTKESFMGATTIFFAVTNALKILPYFYLNVINVSTIELTLYLIPVAGLGALVGILLNRAVSDRYFTWTMYILLLVTGVQLLLGINPAKLLGVA